MKYIVVAIISVLAVVCSSFSTSAASIKELPVTQTSGHWKVTLGKAETDQVKEEKDVFNLYSIDIKNVGEKVYDLTFEVYRDEPNSKTMLGLSYVSSSDQDFYHHTNQPVSIEAKQIEVIVTWIEKPYEQLTDGKKVVGQKYKESFIFYQE
ncbi:hypothetical protein E1I69_12755 [Bacillus timonensis]|uniref:Uncharacterized protein n=1 Tax=Bacillus timonensis TaxID=1033734 RepID=A0A4S3PQY1_9BACI|nr:hypothetical protein [Bacillus timonensis]THE12029.1 hypothetical protein E1I69_12755 [Bacillus timonensis]